MLKRKIIITTEPTQEHWFETQDGKKLMLPVLYTIRIDLEKGMYYTSVRNNSKYVQLPSLTECINQGLLIEKYSYETIRYMPQKDTDREIVKETLDFFHEKGFNVTEEAIMHNLMAYDRDEKSGYRDEKNGYHLFTPCCCNPLTFTVTTLSTLSQDWQNTYSC